MGTAQGVSGVVPAWSAPTPLVGAVYAEPLVCGNAVYVATEQNRVYAVNLTSGGVLWERNPVRPCPAPPSLARTLARAGSRALR